MIEGYIKRGMEFLERHLVLRYLIVGGSAGVSDLIVLYILHNLFGLHYLFSAVLAFVVAFLISFTFHKFWTFKSHDEKTHRQLVLYFGNAMFSLVMNTILMYLFVDHLHIQVILSQIIVGLIVACFTFFISRNFVFKYKRTGDSI